MRKIALAALALLLIGGRTGTAAEITPRLSGPALPFAQLGGGDGGEMQRDLRVRVWTEDERDLFRPGERTRVLLRTDEDAYVAVLHVDTRGDVEVLFPATPYDDGFLRGRRLYSLPGAGAASRSWSVQGSPGIGYLYAVASEEPLNLRAIRGLFRGHGSWRGERVVYGDPFAALERISRELVPDPYYGGFAEDWFSYHVGRRHSHPRYACYDGYSASYYGGGDVYGSCDRVRIVLRDRPYYYDTRQYRGDRRVYYQGYAGGSEPTHRYKERTNARSETPVRRRPDGSYDYAPPPRTRARDDDRARQQQDPPARQRPTLERRRPEPQSRERAPREAPPARGRPQREETRTAAPARRAEPRVREAPPARSRGSSSNGSSGARVRPDNS